MDSSSSTITVAICTFNRARSLASALSTFVEQEDPETEWELLVVDNNSTDRTKEVVRTFADQLPLRSVFEPRQGLSHARNRAIAEARGEILLFTDDDVRLHVAWLRSYHRAAIRFPRAEYFAGRILAEWPGSPPRWFREDSASLFDGVLVSLDLGVESRLLKDVDPLPIGASFGLRRSLFHRNGEFRTDLGVRGLENGRGEETEYVLRGRRAGAAGAYVGEALCWHPTDIERFRLLRLFRHGIASGIAHRAIRAPESRGSIARGLLFLLRGGYQLLKGRGDRFRQCVLNCGVEVGMRRSG